MSFSVVGYLGDGIPNLPEGKMDDSHNICLGTDCNNRLSMIEEMRWLAYCQQVIKKLDSLHKK